jgi:RecA/RadA recombinase
MAKQKEHSADIYAAFKVLDDLNPDATFLDQNTLSRVSSWIDTGCLALNAIISGSLYGGIPSGRLTGFSGPQACGKTYIINKIIANAQKEGRFAVVFDTENAVDKDTAEALGCDPSKIKYCPVETVEQCRNQVSAFLDSVIEKGLKGKFIIAIDSLGNLVSTKEMNDVAAGKEAMDMGTRAKGLKSMMRVLTLKAAKADTPVIFSNHIYANPADMYPSLVKQQSGGSGPLYLASVLVQMAVKNEKSSGGQNSNRDAVEDVAPIAKDINGITLRTLTIKNRFAPPFLEAEMYLNFRNGLGRYSGLLDMALGYGIVVQNGPTFALADGTKLGYYKSWRQDEDIWENKILPELEKKLQVELKYKKEVIETKEEQEENVSIDEDN